MTMKKENEGNKAFKEEGSGRNSREATNKAGVGWWIARRAAYAVVGPIQIS
jgi:hypothetical protein